MRPQPAINPEVRDSDGPTGKLCNWVHSLSLSDVPEEIQTRAKYLILDGIACALIGAHLPWSETAARAVFSLRYEYRDVRG